MKLNFKITKQRQNPKIFPISQNGYFLEFLPKLTMKLKAITIHLP
jgi:hypothetical protein